MRPNIGIILALLFSWVTASSQIELPGANGEMLYIELEGITNITRLQDPMGNWTNDYTYRRADFNLDMTIRPHITIVGGQCTPNSYFYGGFSLFTKMMTGFHYDQMLNRYLPIVTPPVDSLNLSKGSSPTGFGGQIDFSRHYKSQHALTFEIFLTMIDPVGPPPLCQTPSQVSIQFWLYPEFTFQELWLTNLANASNSDQIFWMAGNCNACNKKGVPGFSVSSVSLLPFFSDQDYAYTSLGPDLDFSRSFTYPGTTGMFGDGWSFNYEQELTILSSMVEYRNGSGGKDMYTSTGDTSEPFLYAAEKANRKRLSYFPSQSRFEIFDPDTKLISDFQRYSASNDSLGFHLTRIRDLHGNAISVSYNAHQKISSITDAAGRVTSFQYNSNDRCILMTLPDGRTCAYQYNSNGLLNHITDTYENDVAFSYDSIGFVKTMKVNQDSAVFNYLYQSGGNQLLSSSTNLDGNTTQYYVGLIGPDIQHNYIRDPSGVETMFEINPRGGSVYAKKDIATGARQYMEYDGNRMLTDLTLPTGVNSHTIYDSLKRVVQTTDFRGMPTSIQYDTLDNITAMTDAEGNTWKWFYDTKGSLTEKQTPSGKKETYTYYPNGLVKTHTYGTSQTYSFTYDNFGNISKLTWPNGGESLYEYDQKGLRCTGYSDPLGNRTTFEYDDLDRVTQTNNPDGTSFKTLYDCCAPTGIIDENGNTKLYERNPLLKITRITNAEGNAVTYVLDSANRIIERISPDNNKTKYSYNSLGKITEETDPFNETVAMEYNLDGMLSKITDQSGNISTYQRTGNGNPVSRTIGSSTISYVRDSLDRITSITNARGQIMTFSYNADGFVQERNFAGITDSYTYDALNRLSGASNSESSVSIEYNEMNAINQLNYDGDHFYHFDYDQNKNLIKTTYSDNSEAVLRRDNRGRVVSLIIGSDSVVFGYDAASNLTTIHQSNGLGTLIHRNKTNDITSIRTYKLSDTLIKRDYIRNEMGYITREIRSENICSGTVFMPSDTGGFYQTGNQLSLWQNFSYYYDSDGNLIQVNPGVFSAIYDNLNRLEECIQDNGTVKVNYYYNAKGYSARKQFQNGSSVNEYKFFYDASNRVIEIHKDGNSDISKFYYNDKSLVACMIGSEFYFYHFDQQGNTIALSNRAGEIVQTYCYDAWGKILNETGSIEQPFKYSGAWGVMHEYNYLYRMPYRFYDSYTGKFIQIDPSGFKDGFNLYEYAKNNPVNFIDPSGLGSDEAIYNKEIQREEEEEAKREADPNYDIYEEQRAYEQWGTVCNLLAYLIPGAKAGQAKAEGKPEYEVGIEAGKKLPPGYNIPFYVGDVYNRLLKAMQNDSPGLKKIWGDPDRPPVGGGRKSVYY